MRWMWMLAALLCVAAAQAADVYVVEGRTLIPLRQVGETFGAAVQYDSASKGINISLEYQKVDMTVGGSRARVGERDVDLEVAAVVVNGITYVPARFISDAFGFQISWSQVERQVTVINPKTHRHCVLAVSRHVPPGLAKKGGIPPGLAKKDGVPPGQVKKDDAKHQGHDKNDDHPGKGRGHGKH